MNRTRWALVLLGAALEFWAIAALVWSPGADIPRHVALFLGAWLAYVLAIRLVLVRAPGPVAGDLALIFLVAFLVRATFLLTPPSLSDDVYRAVWDARVMHAGINPYAYAPAAPELDVLRDQAIWPRVNHKEQRTPYPPLSELLGGAAYWALPERLLAFQVLATTLDLVAAGLLAWLLARVGQDPRRSLVIAWSPAGAIHFAHSGHNDAAMVAALIGAALLLSFDRRWAAMAALGAATMVKAVPALAVPAFLRATGPGGAVAWLLTLVVMAVPFASAGLGAVSGLTEEGSAVAFNDSLHFAVQRISAALGDVGTPIPTVVSLAVALVAAALIARFATPSPLDMLKAGSRVLGIFILVAPAVQPWYAPWVAPLIAVTLRPAGGWLGLRDPEGQAWLWFTGAVALTELTYVPGTTGLWPAIRLVEYGPLYALLSLALWSWWRAKREAIVRGGEPPR